MPVSSPVLHVIFKMYPFGVVSRFKLPHVASTYIGILFRLDKGGHWTRATAWMTLEDILQSEISQTRKENDCMIPLT